MDENVIMKSGSGSRRGSDEEDDKDLAVRQDPSSHRSSDRYVDKNPPLSASAGADILPLIAAL